MPWFATRIPCSAAPWTTRWSPLWCEPCTLPVFRRCASIFAASAQSEGAFDAGRGETADAAAVATYGAVRWPGRRLVLAGFSFGAYVALRLAQQRELSRLITVAPPVERFDFSGLAAPACPWLLVQGDADDVVDPHRVLAWAEALEPPPRLLVMPGVGHFFHGHLSELRDAVVDAIRSG